MEMLRRQLKKLLQTYHQYVSETQLMEKFKFCEIMVHKSSEFDPNYKKESVNIEGNEFEYLGPQELHQDSLSFTNEESSAAAKVLRAYRKAAEAQIESIKKKIREIQAILESPYIKYKERPYHLHAVIVHDGLATNGHYYSYIFDRVSQQWWMLNDHRASMVEEEQVMTEAYGGHGYKSACNLFYVSNHIIDEMKK